MSQDLISDPWDCQYLPQLRGAAVLECAALSQSPSSAAPKAPTLSIAREVLFVIKCDKCYLCILRAFTWTEPKGRENINVRWTKKYTGFFFFFNNCMETFIFSFRKEVGFIDFQSYRFGSIGGTDVQSTPLLYSKCFTNHLATDDSLKFLLFAATAIWGRKLFNQSLFLPEGFLSTSVNK